MFAEILGIALIILFFWLSMWGGDWGHPKNNIKEKIEERNTELNRKLMRMLQEPKRQPELWWGDECVTLREDGKAVLHLRRPTAKEKHQETQTKRLIWEPITLNDSMGTDYFSLSGREIFKRSIDGELVEVRWESFHHGSA